MAKNKIDIRENPLVQQRDDRKVAAIRGFLAGVKGDCVRLYSGLSLEEYVDIPEGDVVDIAYDRDDARSPCTVLVRVAASLRYRREEIIPVEEALKAGRGACGCADATYAAAAPTAPGGPGLPPMGCEIRREMQRNVCDEFEMGWCGLKYYLCRLDCIFGDAPIGGGTTAPGAAAI